MTVAIPGASLGVPPVVVRGARLLAIAIVIGWSVANVIQRVGAWSLSDMDAYWNAALRLRDGGDLYPAVTDPGGADVYRYAAWFAWLWVPLTQLPKSVVAAGWSLVLLVASGAAVLPVLRRPSLAALAAAALLASLLVWSASSGNVQPLLVAMLVHGVERRSGPLWVGVAASLKIVPVLLLLVYLARGQWFRALAGIAITGGLWSTALTQNLSQYPLGTADSPNPLLVGGPLLYSIVVCVACLAVVVTARGRNAWLTASVAVFLAIPRASLIELSYLAIAQPAHSTGTLGLDEAAVCRATVPAGPSRPKKSQRYGAAP
jgi:hypothetical protein